MTDQEVNQEFKSLLKQYNRDRCPKCKKLIDRGDVCWNSGNTDEGTGYSVVEIQCQRCDTEIVYGTSWYPDVSSFEDMVFNVLEDALEY